MKIGTITTRSAALAGAAAMLTLAAQPCAAAGDPRDIGATVTRTGAFAVGTVRLDLGGGKGAKPSARLQLGMTSTQANAFGAPSSTLRAAVLELGGSERGTPELFVGGQKMKNLKTRAELQGSTGTVLLVVGAVAAAAVLVAMAGPDGNDEECGNDDWFC